MNQADLATELRSAALAYATIGWPVFPLAPRSKVPVYSNPHRAGSTERAACRGRFAPRPESNASGALRAAPCGKDGHGVLDASTDPEVIGAWWARTPHANIGLACGLTTGWGGDGAGSGGGPWWEPYTREGPDVLDIDVKAGAPGLDSLERLRLAGLVANPIAKARTASGGWHLFYDGSRQGNGSLRGLGVDFRSAGGYVVVAPSVVSVDVPAIGATGDHQADGHEERAYQWTRWNLSLDTRISWSAVVATLKPPPARMLRTALDREQRAGGRTAHLAAWLESQGAGNRNNALHWAVCAALENGASREVLDDLETVAYRIGLSASEVRKTIDSAIRKVISGARPTGDR